MKLKSVWRLFRLRMHFVCLWESFFSLVFFILFHFYFFFFWLLNLNSIKIENKIIELSPVQKGSHYFPFVGIPFVHSDTCKSIFDSPRTEIECNKTMEQWVRCSPNDNSILGETNVNYPLSQKRIVIFPCIILKQRRLRSWPMLHKML